MAKRRKRKIPPSPLRLKVDISKRLIEVRFERQKIVVCVRCYRRMRSGIKYDRSMRKGFRIGGHSGVFTGSHTYYPLQRLAQPAGWEKIVCCKCGQKNENPNQRERDFTFGGSIE